MQIGDVERFYSHVLKGPDPDSCLLCLGRSAMTDTAVSGSAPPAFSELLAELLAHWTRPQDPAGFERDYIATNLPLAQQWPDLVSTQFSRTTDPTAAAEPVAYTFHARFTSEVAFEAASQSPIIQRILDDAQLLESTYECISCLLVLRDPIEATTSETV